MIIDAKAADQMTKDAFPRTEKVRQTTAQKVLEICQAEICNAAAAGRRAVYVPLPELYRRYSGQAVETLRARGYQVAWMGVPQKDKMLISWGENG